MIEMIVMVFGVLPWFYRTAKTQGRNPVGWIAIGAMSYYIPVLIMGYVILPAAWGGRITRDNAVALAILAIPLVVGAGIAGCLVARRALLPAPARPRSAAEAGVSGTGHFRRGVELLNNGDCTGALREFHMSLAVTHGGQKADSFYNVAVCNAKLGNIDAALEAVAQAVAIDRALALEIGTDNDFGPLASIEAFQEIVRRADGRATRTTSD